MSSTGQAKTCTELMMRWMKGQERRRGHPVAVVFRATDRWSSAVGACGNEEALTETTELKTARRQGRWQQGQRQLGTGSAREWTGERVGGCRLRPVSRNVRFGITDRARSNASGADPVGAPLEPEGACQAVDGCLGRRRVDLVPCGACRQRSCGARKAGAGRGSVGRQGAHSSDQHC